VAYAFEQASKVRRRECGSVNGTSLNGMQIGRPAHWHLPADVLSEPCFALGLEQQANLLRVIDSGEYEPVGSNETQHCTARIIVASNWNLEEAVDRGKFRSDLYHRLNVLSLHLPPLRERVQDIGLLVRRMAARFNNQFHKHVGAIHPQALAALEAFPWPGNIRQLENVVRYAVLVSTGSELLWHHLPQPLQEYACVHPCKVQASDDPLRDARERAEQTMIQRALVHSGYRLADAARWLRISRVTLYKKMKKLGISRKQRYPSTEAVSLQGSHHVRRGGAGPGNSPGLAL
jgi:DNA-binding NtrC family response regulator